MSGWDCIDTNVTLTYYRAAVGVAKIEPFGCGAVVLPITSGNTLIRFEVNPSGCLLALDFYPDVPTAMIGKETGFLRLIAHEGSTTPFTTEVPKKP
eukprot:TRINITY_DN24307_c0_g1_i1.p1 TRINITY_DN24307_c0_g1~~TRINITY_DN24307_c0_g1_i1.p1  ORF type:complete len:110 (+),score=35.24 TRINITY_DN24307_c0_g1_i1:44-331(+)